MKRNLLSLLLLSMLLSHSAFYPQITITKDDLSKYYARGNVITSYIYTKTVDVNIGKPGGGNSWDFSFLESNLISSTLTVQEPASTPFLSNFPGANLAFYVTSFEEDNNSEAFFPDVWLYNSLGDDLTTLGNGGRGTIMGVEMLSLTYNKPAYVFMKLPASYGQSWTQTYTDSTVSKAAGISSYSTGSSTVNTSIDAYGLMKMPGGYSVQAVRIKRDIDGYLKSQYGQYSKRKVMEYVFQGKNGDMVSVSASSLTQPPDGILRTGEIVWTQSKASDVPGKSPAVNEFSLSRNYPNPFNPETILEYSLPEEAFVDIRVFDALGREVSRLLSKNEMPGLHKISFNGGQLPAGVYFLHMKAGNFNAVRKMALIK